MSESKDLADGWFQVENADDWIHCPHCGSENVDVENASAYTPERMTVDCRDCPANGFYQ